MKLKYDIFLKDLARKSGVVMVAEHKFCDTRKWLFDYAVPELKIAIEYEGQGGQHNTFIGYSRDCEKYNTALLLGWKVFRLTAWHFNKENFEKTERMLTGILRRSV